MKIHDPLDFLTTPSPPQKKLKMSVHHLCVTKHRSVDKLINLETIVTDYKRLQFDSIKFFVLFDIKYLFQLARCVC
jgi:hypothetical protein